MAKRRSKKKPNIPQATLDRARKQAGLEVEAASQDEAEPQAEPQKEAEEPVTAAAPTEAAAPATTPDAAAPAATPAAAQPQAAPATTPERSSRRRKISQVQLERSRAKGELTREMIEEILHNPTETVSAEQLAREYGHVLRDLRNMGILAIGLMVLLVGLAQFI